MSVQPGQRLSNLKNPQPGQDLSQDRMVRTIFDRLIETQLHLREAQVAEQRQALLSAQAHQQVLLAQEQAQQALMYQQKQQQEALLQQQQQQQQALYELQELEQKQALVQEPLLVSIQLPGEDDPNDEAPIITSNNDIMI